MMRLLLPVVLLLVGLGGGVAAGLMLAGVPDEVGGEVADEPIDETGSEAADAEGEVAADGPASPEPGTATPTGTGTEYVRLNNQFVVPIVRNGSVRSLVVISLTLEVDVGQGTAVFDREPRLRDSFLRVMFAHANAGGFDGSFTEATAMEPLREALREAARGVASGATVYDVLITDITRQDA